MKYSMRFFSLLVIATLLSSCGGMKMGGGKSQGTLFTSFYIGEGKEQYFIKPLEFETESKEALAKLDFTIKSVENQPDSCRINFSYLTSDRDPQIDSIRISVNGKLSDWLDANRFFKRLDKTRGFEHRYAVHMELDFVKLLFESPSESHFIVPSKDKTDLFMPTKKTNKRMTRLWNSMFQLL